MQKYSVNAEIPQGSILGRTLLLLYINDLPDDVASNIAIYADDTNLYSKCILTLISTLLSLNLTY